MWWLPFALAHDPADAAPSSEREVASEHAWAVPVRLPERAPLPSAPPLPRPARLNPAVSAVGALLVSGAAVSAAWAGSWALGRAAAPPARGLR